MPIPSRPTPNTSTPPRLPQIEGQSNLDGFVSLARPLMIPNNRDVRKENKNTNIASLQRNRRIRDDDDDDDVPLVIMPQPANESIEVVEIADTENESDANFGVILLPQRQLTHHHKIESTKSRRTHSPAPAELTVTQNPV
jgi:hypothetical protein